MKHKLSCLNCSQNVAVEEGGWPYIPQDKINKFRLWYSVIIPTCSLRRVCASKTSKHTRATHHLPPTQTNTALVSCPCYYGCSHTEPLSKLFPCVCVSVAVCVSCLQC